MNRMAFINAAGLALLGIAVAHAVAAEPGLSWVRTPHKLNRYILQKSEDTEAFDSNYATCPFVFRENDRFYMTYVGHDGVGYQTGLACSDDLVHWDLTHPILRPEEGAEWERGGLYKSYLLEEGGTYYLFYNAKNKTRGPWREQTGMAVSRDLQEWTRYPGNPVIPNGPQGSPDELFASDPVVMKADSTWLLFYFGLASDRHARDLLVFSSDLTKFTKTNEIIVDVGAKGTIDDRHAHKPSLIYWQGDLYHFYDAVCNAGGPHPTNAVRGISVARSRPWSSS